MQTNSYDQWVALPGLPPTCTEQNNGAPILCYSYTTALDSPTTLGQLRETEQMSKRFGGPLAEAVIQVAPTNTQKLTSQQKHLCCIRPGQ